MRLNMGCGHNKRAGYVNVDAEAACEPDQVWNLERTPWPWPNDSAQEVMFIHSLEHMGGDPKVFLAMMKELYRIAAPGAQIVIHAPHPRHDNFINDPTHVRIITPQVLSLFDRERNDEWKRQGAANSPLAHYTGVNFKLKTHGVVLGEPFKTLFQEGKLTAEQLADAQRTQNNVAVEYRITLTAVKP